MIFAQVSNSLVVNTLVLNDISLLSNYYKNPITGIPYDYILQVDATFPQPGIGWGFDGIRFIPPDINIDDDEDTSSSILEEQSVTSTTSIGAPVSNDALMTLMSLSPGAGTYLVLFNCDISSSVVGATISTSIYVTGVQVSGSLRKVIPYTGGTLSAPPGRESVSISQTIQILGTDTIEIWWSSSNSGPTSASRSLTVLRVGN